MFGYIYKTTDLETGKIYVGQKRSKIFLGTKYFGSGKIIRRIIKKYKDLNLDINNRLKVELLEECMSQEELNDREMFWIKELNSHSIYGYNLSDGGGGGNHNLGKTFPNRKHHDNSGENNPMYGKTHTEETKKLIGDANRGKRHTDDVNKKKGRPGTVMPKETREKISVANTGKEFSESHKERISQSRKGRIFITNGIETKSIYPEEMSLYDESIWRRGRTFKSNPWNKGETASTNQKLKDIGQKTKATRTKNGGYIPWNKKQ